ncbi:MAG: hypothetical protein ACYTG0_18510 [Planctomycetota bacterium]
MDPGPIDVEVQVGQTSKSFIGRGFAQGTAVMLVGLGILALSITNPYQHWFEERYDSGEIRRGFISEAAIISGAVVYADVQDLFDNAKLLIGGLESNCDEEGNLRGDLRETSGKLLAELFRREKVGQEAIAASKEEDAEKTRKAGSEAGFLGKAIDIFRYVETGKPEADWLKKKLEGQDPAASDADILLDATSEFTTLKTERDKAMEKFPGGGNDG